MRYQRRHRTGLARATRIGRAFRGLQSKPDRPREQRHFGVVPQHAHRQALGPSRTGRGGTDITTTIWKAGKTAYRRDLDTEDPYGESARIDIDLGHQFRVIVEGALLPRALRRQQARPDALSQTDIDILEDEHPTPDRGRRYHSGHRLLPDHR